MGQAVSKKIVEYLTYEEFEQQLVLGTTPTTNFFRNVPIYPFSDGNGYIIVSLWNQMYFNKEDILIIDEVGDNPLRVITKEQFNEDYTPIEEIKVNPV